MQPTPYTPSTNFAQDERANVGGRSTVRTDRVDAELDAIAGSLNQTISNLGLLQRDDGVLRDATVSLFNLTPTARIALQTKFVQRGLWAATTAYAVGDLVDFAGSAYLCALAHTSSVFATDYALGRWQIFVSVSTAAGLSFTPTGTLASTNAQAAIAESDTENRAASLPTLSAFYGGH